MRGVIVPSDSEDRAAEAAAEQTSRQLVQCMRDAIAAAGGWIDFATFMSMALYQPGLGYYSAGSRKFGSSGDFVTAPELTPLFAQCLATQLADVLQPGADAILELGAGSGALAADVLLELQRLNALPRRYCILDVSGDLRERQRETLARRAGDLSERVHWLDALPEGFTGAVIANEVLDALPVHRIHTHGGEVEELGVVWEHGLQPASRPAMGAVRDSAAALQLPDDYETEINLAAAALIGSLAQSLTRGLMLFIDYGFPAREYYHPQRNGGTLMCHYRHRAHGDPFAYVGLQDITAHVDFTAAAHAAVAAGLDVGGFTSQAQFLINCGMTERLAEVPASDAAQYAPRVAAAQKLLSPAEMGELFKVIAFTRGDCGPLRGFARGDRTHTL